jgi:hypothetical protein
MATLSDVYLPFELLHTIADFVSKATHDEGDTAIFRTSPILASEFVSKDLWRLTLARYRDLRHLALTCRAIRTPSQKALFKHLVIDNIVRRNATCKTGIHCLFNALHHRPDLAKRARSVHIDLISHVQMILATPRTRRKS